MQKYKRPQCQCRWCRCTQGVGVWRRELVYICLGSKQVFTWSPDESQNLTWPFPADFVYSFIQHCNAFSYWYMCIMATARADGWLSKVAYMCHTQIHLWQKFYGFSAAALFLNNKMFIHSISYYDIVMMCFLPQCWIQLFVCTLKTINSYLSPNTGCFYCT